MLRMIIILTLMLGVALWFGGSALAEVESSAGGVVLLAKGGGSGSDGGGGARSGTRLG